MSETETLKPVERRVLGALLEKALAQPQYYPMTLNAIVAACNQKSNRDPVMSLDEDAVWNALEVLRAVGLVTRLMPGGASRVDRYRHEVKDVLGWEKPQRAVMAELLLRGPQTIGELRTRCGRMYPFENTESVAAVLDNLAQESPPRVGSLERAQGQAAVRYAHRLYTPDEPSPWAAAEQRVVQSTPLAAGSETPAVTAPSAAGAADVASLRADIEDVHAELAELHEQIAELRQRLERLES